MSVRIWETFPQPTEVLRWQAHISIVAVCWLQYDAGVVVLCSDGSTDIWTPEEKVSLEERRTLDLISFMRLDLDMAAENLIQCTLLCAVRKTS
jgi:hypothetical protein